MIRKFCIFAVLGFIGISAAVADNRAAPFQVLENGRSYDRLYDAVEAIGAGSGTIIIRPGIYHDCVVQTQGRITYRAAVAGQTIFDGGVCEEKGTFVLRGISAEVDGIIFQNIFVHDGNGAGIRLEQGNLTVTRSLFQNSDQGILSGVVDNAAVSIDQSSFSGLGACKPDMNCAHSIYIGHVKTLSVTHCRFEAGTGGHYLKSRAEYDIIRDNAFDDSRGNQTNYMIDLPHGAAGEISGNIFVQGQSKENASAFITVAPEGKLYDSSGLSIMNNDASIVPGVDRNVGFVVDWSGDTIALGANRLGRGLIPLVRR